jgi:hypothetical protein
MNISTFGQVMISCKKKYKKGEIIFFSKIIKFDMLSYIVFLIWKVLSSLTIDLIEFLIVLEKG